MSACLPAVTSAARCKSSGESRTGGYWRVARRPASRSFRSEPRFSCPRNSAGRRISIDMLQSIVVWSIRNRVVVVVLAVFLLVLGAYAAGHARLDVFPEFAPPEVVVQTEAPG